MSDKLVSIITPAYNSAQTIEKTIKSVLEQDYPHWEMLIADDCSTDNTAEVVQKYVAADDRIKWIPRRWNGGAAVTRNRAIQAATGRFIAFLDADDSWHPEKLSKQLKFMESNNAALSYTAYRRVSADGSALGLVTPPTTLTYSQLLNQNQIGCLTAIYDTDKVGKIYMPNISKRQDFALWLRILKKVDCAHGLSEVLADYLVASNSLSANKVHAAKYQWRVYREVEKLPRRRAIRHFLRYAYNGVKGRV